MYMKITFLLLVGVSGVLSAPRCEHGFFWNRVSSECTPCTRCKDTEITQRLCYDDQDSVCTPWPKLHFLHNPLQPSNAATNDVDVSAPRITELPTTAVEFATSEDNKWFTVTMILAGILVLATVAVVVVVLVTCVVCRRKKREIVTLYSAGFLSSRALLQDCPDGRAEFKVVPETET